MIVFARLSCPTPKEGRTFSGSFAKLWGWLDERYAKRSTKLTAAQYLSLMSLMMNASETVEEYVSCSEKYFAVLEAVEHKVHVEVVVRAIVGSLHSCFYQWQRLCPVALL